MKTIGSVIVSSVLFILLLVTPVIGSSDWVEYGTSKNGDILLYDKGNIKKGEGKSIIQVKVTEILSDEKRDKYIQTVKKGGMFTESWNNLIFTISLFEIDCLEKRMKILHYTLYDTNGKSLYSSSDQNWDYITPHTINDTLRKKVCLNVISSEDWVEYGWSEKGSVFLYNKTNIQKGSGKSIIKVWNREILSDERKDQFIQFSKKSGMFTEEFNNIEFTTYLVEIDCLKQKTKILSYILYNTDGESLSSDSSSDQKWDYITPDTIDDNLRKKVCK